MQLIKLKKNSSCVQKQRNLAKEKLVLNANDWSFSVQRK